MVKLRHNLGYNFGEVSRWYLVSLFSLMLCVRWLTLAIEQMTCCWFVVVVICPSMVYCCLILLWLSG